MEPTGQGPGARGIGAPPARSQPPAEPPRESVIAQQTAYLVAAPSFVDALRGGGGSPIVRHLAADLFTDPVQALAEAARGRRKVFRVEVTLEVTGMVAPRIVALPPAAAPAAPPPDKVKP